MCFLAPAGDFVTHTLERPRARVDRGTDADVFVPMGKAEPSLGGRAVPNFAERKEPTGIVLPEPRKDQNIDKGQWRRHSVIESGYSR